MDVKSLACLVVDDSSTMRRIIRACLGRCGFSNIEEAGNSDEALEKLRSGSFGLIFTDWNMPGMDGLELVKQIRQMPDYALTPVIMITTEQGRDDVLAAMRNGVNSYIVKPFTPDVIKSKIDAVFAARQ